MTQSDFEERFSHLISQRAKDRKIETFYTFDLPSEIEKHPDPISLAGGCPNEGFFPVESIHLNLIKEPFQHLDYKDKSSLTNKKDINVTEQIHKIEQESAHIYRYTEDADKEIDIARGFQYAETNGLPQLRSFAKQIVQRVAQPATEDWDIIITNGSGDSIHKVNNLIVDPGSTVLVEEFTFTPFKSTLFNYGGVAIPVKLNIRDTEEPGIDAEYLDDLLTNWSTSEYKHLPKPRALYTIPTGQNPTGLSQPLSLRKKIYAIAEKHDFIILEDDPYGYISLPKYGTPNVYKDANFTTEKYIKEYLKPSYASLDKSGRVIRLETFSKLFAPGLRLGFIAANPYLIKKISLHSAVSTRSPSGISQLLLNNIIVNWGGLDGWLEWARKVANEYTERRDVLLKALYDSKSYAKKQFDIVEPDAGMFIIIYINLEKYFPNPKDWEKVLTELRYKAVTNGIDIVFGNRMTTDLQFKYTTPKSNFVRITIAAAHDFDELKEAARRLTQSFEDFFAGLESGSYDHYKQIESK